MTVAVFTTALDYSHFKELKPQGYGGKTVARKLNAKLSLFDELAYQTNKFFGTQLLLTNYYYFT